MIYFTELDRLPVFDAVGEYLGHLEDLAVDPSQNSLRVAAYHVRAMQKKLLCITHDQMQSVSVRSAQTSVPKDRIRCYGPDEGLMMVRKDVLDQQIIDVNHRKVVRVNDVDLDIQPTNGHTELRIVGVNVGLAAALRRLLQGVLAKHRIRTISSLFPSKTIPWAFVNLIEPDPARRVKLRISYDRLARLHPADIGDILEELSRDERTAVVARRSVRCLAPARVRDVRVRAGHVDLHDGIQLVARDDLRVAATIDGAIAHHGGIDQVVAADQRPAVA